MSGCLCTLTCAQPYFDMMRVIEALTPTSQELTDGEVLLLQRVLEALQDFGSVLYFDVKKTVVRVQIYQGMEYLEKKVGQPWALRTPYEIMIYMGIERRIA